MKFLKYLLLLLTLSLSADTTITITDCNASDVKAYGSPVTLIKVKSTCTVDMGTGNKAPNKIISSSSVAEGEIATLNGSTITDPDGTITSYRWEQKRGETVELTNGDQSIATFPTPNQGQELIFWVYVTDNDGAVTFSSFRVNTLEPLANEAPIADAGADDTFNENQLVTLDCNSSTDVNDNIESRVWTQTAGTAVTIILPEQGIASYNPPDVSSPTELIFQCEVTDTGALSDSDTVTHTIEAVSTGVVYYVSDCGPSADDDCIEGDDANDGQSKANALKTYDAAQDLFAGLDSGDEIRWARGGDFVVAGSNLWVNDNTEGADPLIVSDYTPTWGSGDENRPIITQVGNPTPFLLSDGGGANSDGGYIFSNLDIRCVSQISPSAGFIFGNDVDDLTIDNVNVDGCYLGVHSQTSNTCEEGDSNCNGRNDNIIVRSSTFSNNKRAGFFGHGDDLVIEDNIFTNNGAG